MGGGGEQQPDGEEKEEEEEYKSEGQSRNLPSSVCCVAVELRLDCWCSVGPLTTELRRDCPLEGCDRSGDVGDCMAKSEVESERIA